MKYLIDTNMCIYAQKQEPSVLSKIRENYRDGIAISSITLAELEYGVQASASRERNTVALLKFLAIVDVLPFDSKAAAEYGKIRADSIRITMEINNAYHTHDEIVSLMSELTGTEIHESFGLFPPFYTDCGKNGGNSPKLSWISVPVSSDIRATISSWV